MIILLSTERDGVAWGLEHEEVQRRRRVRILNLLSSIILMLLPLGILGTVCLGILVGEYHLRSTTSVYMTAQSLVHGRPGALLIHHTDCQFAEDLEPSVKHSGETELGCMSFFLVSFTSS